jgi:hypothetical protein
LSVVGNPVGADQIVASDELSRTTIDVLSRWQKLSGVTVWAMTGPAGTGVVPKPPPSAMTAPVAASSRTSADAQTVSCRNAFSASKPPHTSSPTAVGGRASNVWLESAVTDRVRWSHSVAPVAASRALTTPTSWPPSAPIWLR